MAFYSCQGPVEQVAAESEPWKVLADPVPEQASEELLPVPAFSGPSAS